MTTPSKTPTPSIADAMLATSRARAKPKKKENVKIAHSGLKNNYLLGVLLSDDERTLLYEINNLFIAAGYPPGHKFVNNGNIMRFAMRQLKKMSQSPDWPNLLKEYGEMCELNAEERTVARTERQKT